MHVSVLEWFADLMFAEQRHKEKYQQKVFHPVANTTPEIKKPLISRHTEEERRC
jgi:hypothetical protein